METLKTLKISLDLHRGLKRLSAEDGISIQQHANDALREYLQLKAQEQAQQQLIAS